MSITFFIPDSPTREVVYDEGGPHEWKTSEDIYPSANFSNINAYALMARIVAFGGDMGIPEFDSCGTWTPNQACTLAGVLITMFEHQEVAFGDVSRMMRLYTVLQFAADNDMSVNWS